VTAYAVRLGQEMGLSRDELRELARGALLHDVGKIGIPDAILNKPAKLTDAEYEEMKQHVQHGYQMLRHIEFLQPALAVVRYHHERWEGGGYPHGIAGREIPVFALIFAVCDTYDAITSNRPYRRGRSYTEARAEIIRCRGTQFSPEVVDTFLRIPEQEWTGAPLSPLTGGMEETMTDWQKIS
jgi:HD-GYP domain-containing protein (c-di-GMP phosphodiesterase class II)